MTKQTYQEPEVDVVYIRIEMACMSPVTTNSVPDYTVDSYDPNWE